MRAFVGGLVLLAACGGGDKDGSDDGCSSWTVTVTVVDSAGDPVEGAAVTLGDSECSDDGGGVYTCDGVPGSAVLSIDKTPDFNVYAETVTIDETVCEIPVDVALPPPLVY